MKLSIEEVIADTERYKLELMPDYAYMLKHHPEIVDKIANGVGSESMGILYHLTPDTIWFVNINSVSHQHDWMYSLPFKFKTTAEGLAYKAKADKLLLTNCYKIAATRNWPFKQFMCTRSDSYYKALSHPSGNAAFWVDKQLPSDYKGEPPKCSAEGLLFYEEVTAMIPKKLRQG